MEDKRVHAFPKSISPKANVIARLDFELVTTRSLSSKLATTPQRFLMYQY